MARLLFEKKGRTVWISHLDLMRLFQRAFKRAGLPLKHTQGFNPRPSVSIALPLSVGMESCCELLDFDLECQMPDCEAVCNKLNNALIEGVHVLKVYEDGKKIRDLALLSCEVVLEYDAKPEVSNVEKIRELFASKELLVTKKGKNGPVEQDIAPMIKKMDVQQREEGIVLSATICCQNPSLNPALLAAAVERYLPEFAPQHTKCRRLEIYDNSEKIFR